MTDKLRAAKALLRIAVKNLNQAQRIHDRLVKQIKELTCLPGAK